MRIALRAPEEDLAIQIGPARPLPLDWTAWRDALVEGEPVAPPVEQFTVPEGWAVTIVETRAHDGARVHAFYAVLDRAVAARAVGLAPHQIAAARALFVGAAPVWDEEIVALVQL